MADEERHTVTYSGSPAEVQSLVLWLKAERCRVEAAPIVRNDLPGAAELVVVELIVWGGIEAIKAGIAKFKARRSNARIEIDDEDSAGYL